MTAESPQSDYSKLERVFARQTRVKFLPELELRPAEDGKVGVLKGDHWHTLTIFEAVETWKRREISIRSAELDPLIHGHEPSTWDEMDWRICKLRTENPNVAIEFLALGGNGAGKSYYGVSRQVRCGVYNNGWLIWNFTTDELKSKTVMQQIAYRYLPKELRPDNPNKKMKRNRDQHIIFKNASGFTDNKIGFPALPHAQGQPPNRGCVMQFRYHSAELDTLTGPRPQFAYSDEEITLPWVDAITNRLHTAAERATPLLPLFMELLAQKRINRSMKFPREHLHKIFMGVHLITFTPEHGYNTVVHSFTKDATTVYSVDAELLPLKDEQGGFVGFEQVPKFQRCRMPHRAVFYLHPYENVHGGNWEGMKVSAKSKTRENILWWAYGIASRKSHVRFAKFSVTSHARPESTLQTHLKDGTWYHVVDPCPGRNMAMGWYKVNALGQVFIAREWPQEDDYIPGVGYPGPWAVEGQKLDGDKGGAQQPWGLGLDRYREEIDRVEKELGKLEGGNGPIHVPEGNRIMDSRSGNTPSLEHTETSTLILKFGTVGLNFVPSGKASGAKDGDTRVEESVTLVENLLDYDVDKMSVVDGSVSFGGKAPLLYVNQRCTNHIFGFSTWTNADGQKGACKDFMDLVRYLSMADPYHKEERKYDPTINHGVY